MLVCHREVQSDLNDTEIGIALAQGVFLRGQDREILSFFFFEQHGP